MAALHLHSGLSEAIELATEYSWLETPLTRLDARPVVMIVPILPTGLESPSRSVTSLSKAADCPDALSPWKVNKVESPLMVGQTRSPDCDAATSTPSHGELTCFLAMGEATAAPTINQYVSSAQSECRRENQPAANRARSDLNIIFAVVVVIGSVCAESAELKVR